MSYTTNKPLPHPTLAGYAMERSEMATQTLCKGLSLFRHVVSRRRRRQRQRRKEEIKARRVKRQNETSHLPFGLFGRFSLYSFWLLFLYFLLGWGNLICNSHESRLICGKSKRQQKRWAGGGKTWLLSLFNCSKCFCFVIDVWLLLLLLLRATFKYFFSRLSSRVEFFHFGFSLQFLT